MHVSRTDKLDALSLRSCIWFLSGVTALWIAGFGVAHSGNMTKAETTVAKGQQTSAALDGQSFSGEFGIVGKAVRGTDTWVFANGSFVSKSCVECGFPQSVYSVLAETGGIKFKSKTNCPVSDAQIVWEGTVNNGEIEGVYTWTKKRWYRTIQKQFWFRGSLDRTIADSN